MIFQKIILVIISLNLFSTLIAQDITTDTVLIGIQEKALLNKMGCPKSQKIVLVFDKVRLNEYQSNLYVLLKVRESDTVYVKELYYERINKNIVFWLIEKQGIWFVIDNLIWSKDIQF